MATTKKKKGGGSGGKDSKGGAEKKKAGSSAPKPKKKKSRKKPPAPKEVTPQPAAKSATPQPPAAITTTQINSNRAVSAAQTQDGEQSETPTECGSPTSEGGGEEEQTVEQADDVDILESLNGRIPKPQDVIGELMKNSFITQGTGIDQGLFGNVPPPFNTAEGIKIITNPEIWTDVNEKITVAIATCAATSEKNVTAMSKKCSYAGITYNNQLQLLSRGRSGMNTSAYYLIVVFCN
jgi:hypothetical protein